MVRRCMVASQQTKGRYRCTRQRWHSGPCAAVPVHDDVPLVVVLIVATLFALAAWAMLDADVFLRVSLTPAVSFTPVNLEANISVKDGRAVRAELDCDSGYYSSSTWEQDGKPHRVTYRQTLGGLCTLTVTVFNDMGRTIGFRTVQATVLGREP